MPRALLHESYAMTPKFENNFGPPPPPILAKNMLPKYAIKWGSYGVKIPRNRGTFTENLAHEPAFMAYKLQLLWHTNPDFTPYEPFLLGVGWSSICWKLHVYLTCVQQMVAEELAVECLQTGFERHGLPPQRAPLDTVYPLREHLNNVQRMLSGGYCEGLFPDTVWWKRLRNTWKFITPELLYMYWLTQKYTQNQSAFQG